MRTQRKLRPLPMQMPSPVEAAERAKLRELAESIRAQIAHRMANPQRPRHLP